MFDRHIEARGYTNRSEAIRDLIRKELNQEAVSRDDDAMVFGTLTIIYDHHRTSLADEITEIQHRFHESIVATTHVHMDHDNCLEVIIIKGKASDIGSISDSIVSIKGVKLGRVVMLEKDLP